MNLDKRQRRRDFPFLILSNFHWKICWHHTFSYLPMLKNLSNVETRVVPKKLRRVRWNPVADAEIKNIAASEWMCLKLSVFLYFINKNCCLNNNKKALLSFRLIMVREKHKKLFSSQVNYKVSETSSLEVPLIVIII